MSLYQIHETKPGRTLERMVSGPAYFPGKAEDVYKRQPVYETVFSTDSAGPQTGRISEKQFDVVDFYSSFTVFACSIVYTRYYTGTKI